MKHKSIILLSVVAIVTGIHREAAPFSYGGNAVVASSYIFRGIRQFHGVAFQGTLEGRLSRLTVGIWYSNVNFESELGHETDCYAKFSIPVGNLKSALGVAAYAYDFDKFNSCAKREVEWFGNAVYEPLALAVYFVPSQKSTQNDPNPSNYWIEFSGTKSTQSLDLTLGLNHGTYSSRFLAIPQKDAVSTVSISASRKICEFIALSWNVSLPISSDLKNRYWSALTFSF